ncbi:ABC transporter ATP-binding protein [Thermospira aquatica]|uniref:ABC transporter ATP-binding protein n=2 Tax=Thermospira aquatica TaxID=2828656 RepID=A0AAX3BGB8_9SPIR|nr:ABC transporter ATP-binding protein [Thermospira aquatica]
METAVHALREVSLTVYQGDFIALTGPSGSGKSTLMYILGLLDTPTSGKYYLLGKPVHTMSGIERATLRNHTLGFVFQNFQLIPRTTALENVEVPLFYRRPHLPAQEIRKRALSMLSLVGLSHRAHHYPTQMSGGQQQRVAIARALVGNPSLLLADEPTGNLDSHTSKEIMELLVDLNKKGLTIVMVTHEEDIASYAKKIIRMRDGEIIDIIAREEKS